MPLSLPQRLALLILGAAGLFNLWVYARFTVDDAFITWRYGRSLIEAGIWAYNPGGEDPTQAYTNPIFALASIPPAYLGWDMVLSFKLISLGIAAALGVALWRLAGDKGVMALALALLLAVPATVAHAVSGLETVLYGGALALWFVAFERRAWRALLGLTLLLALTRPEAWLLIGLHPLAMLLGRAGWGQALRHAAILALAAGAYAAFHLWAFGHVLPNTFFVKSGEGLTLQGLARIAPFALPVLAVAIWGNRRTALLMALYFGPVVYSYAGSDLLMNYFARFPYHLALPLYLYGAVALSRAPGGPGWGMAALAAYLGMYAWQTRSLGDHLGIANYYPRLLASHVELGHALRQMGGPRVAVGDAGVIAFQSRAPILDTIGLGSSRVAHEGLTPAVIADFAPQVILAFADAEGPRDYPPGFEALDAYAAAQGMSDICILTYAAHYTLIVRAATPAPELLGACATSQPNQLDELRFFLAQLSTPPWAYWRE